MCLCFCQTRFPEIKGKIFFRQYVDPLTTHSQQQSMPGFVSWLSETFSLPASVACLSLVSIIVPEHNICKVLLFNRIEYSIFIFNHILTNGNNILTHRMTFFLFLT